MPFPSTPRSPAAITLLLVALSAVACQHSPATPGAMPPAPSISSARAMTAEPPAPPVRWRDLIGEYGPDSVVTIVLERDGLLVAHTARSETPLFESSGGEFSEGTGPRANARLRRQGYGLLIHDGYRPWSVTKMFWDASPEDKHIFVANPAEGSKHNRGAAVDLTLYDLATGAPVEMVSTYDETSDRAYPDYPGGTSRQRWHRALLRRAMEAEGFAVYDAEWWHFDFRDWRRYRIGNTPFEQLGRR
jgi:hypothetical protein